MKSFNFMLDIQLSPKIANFYIIHLLLYIRTLPTP